MWQGFIACAIVITLWFSTRFLSHVDVPFDVGIALSSLYSIFLSYLIIKKTNCIRVRAFFYFYLGSIHEITFKTSSLLTCIYQLMMAAGASSWRLVIVRIFLVVICCLQSIVVVSHHGDILQTHDQKHYKIGIIIIANILFMVWIVCQDLAEQLELEEELIESYEHEGSFRVDHTTTTLVASGIFFANLEHFWGIIEACQQAITHTTKARNDKI